MQIRADFQGQRWAAQARQDRFLLRYTYDSEKKRSKQVVLGTVDRWATRLPPNLSILTDVECEEFREWITESGYLMPMPPTEMS